MAYISVENIDDTTAELVLDGLEQGYSGNERWLTWYLKADEAPTEDSYDICEMGWLDEDYAATYGKSTITEVTSLKPNTTYYVLCVAITSPASWTDSWTASFTTEEKGSGGSEGDYTFNTKYLGTLSSENYSYLGADSHTIPRWVMSFAYNGEATFVCAGSGYTLWFGISDSLDYDYDSLAPVTVLAGGTSGPGQSAVITLNVKKNKTYYVFGEPFNAMQYLTVTPPPKHAFAWSAAMATGLPVKGVSYYEWNDFCDEILAVLTAKGIQNQLLSREVYGYGVDKSLSYIIEQQKMTPADKKITAQRFNVTRFVVGSYAPGGSGIALDKTAKKSRVVADEFHLLAARLNAWESS